MRRGVAAAVALACLACAGDAAAGVFGLVSPSGGVKAPPPFAPTGASPFSNSEIRFPGHVNARQLVVVGVGPDGTPLRVTATQRLVINGTGDYEFLVAAPATTIAPGPGTESQPGLRNVGITWQGFSDRRRVLSAVVGLRTRPAAAALPLRVQVEGGAVRLVDAARRTVPASTGRVKVAQLTQELAVLRAALRRSPVVVTPLTVAGTYTRTVNVDVAAPLRVSGTIDGRAVDVTLGAGRPLEHVVPRASGGAPKLRLRVVPLPTQAIVPGASALRRAADPLLKLQSALAAAATAGAYQRYLGLPDAVGVSTTTYVYRSASAARTAVARGSLSGGGVLGLALGLALGAAALWGLAVLWARS